ncbi:MAG: DUF3696 domain-containing protein [Methylococcaceae bacterium]|nr:DUF3696 domain-containing protein [Methylococcaceae bacterium]
MEVTIQLEEYFNNSKHSSWIGIQNFQGIREYTKIPLAPLTLIYGQNSAGKSTIHDALEFISSFFSGTWNHETTCDYLDRWANHKRYSESSDKGFRGDPSYVIISLSSYITESDYFCWETDHFNNRHFLRDHPIYNLFSCSDQGIGFQLVLHFSTDDKNQWYVNYLGLVLGDDYLFELITDPEKKTENSDLYCLYKLNTHHPAYTYLDSHFENSLTNLISGSFEHYSNDCWLVIRNAELSSSLNWKKPLDWFSYDLENFEELPREVPIVRDLLIGLIMVPSLAAANRFNYKSIPPLRPIPSKRDAVIRLNLINQQFSDHWHFLAKQVCLKSINEYYPSETDQRSTWLDAIDQINRVLSHSHFLGTGYQITGSCFFLAPLDLFSDALGDIKYIRETLINKLDAEVHLKLLDTKSGKLIDIEDVGVGISQIIPVLVAISLGNQVYIQQPELHLHPKLQAQLADAFIEFLNKPLSGSNFIVESHSEHFLLRLLRRIRETNRSDIRHQLFGLTADQVSVLYVDKMEDGSSKVIPLRISADGEFIDRWPYGFFTERDGELFDE